MTLGDAPGVNCVQLCLLWPSETSDVMQKTEARHPPSIAAYYSTLMNQKSCVPFHVLPEHSAAMNPIRNGSTAG